MTDKYHQFDSVNTLLNIFVPELEKIWAENDATTLKGAITSFPYERKEVEQVLTEFKDAGGKIVRINNKALFRRCNSVMTSLVIHGLCLGGLDLRDGT